MAREFAVEVAHFSFGSPPSAPASAPHWRLPDASVSKTVVPLQLVKVETLREPPVIASPPAKVDVARVEVTAKVPVERPPAKVEVAVVEVPVKLPRTRVPMDEDAVTSPPFKRRTVEVAFAMVPAPQVVAVKGKPKTEDAAA